MTADATGEVLVVDDDPAVSKVLAALLAQAGIACRQVPDAPSALEALRARPVDVVVTDLRMPGPSGVDLLEAIVARWPEVPVILLTAHGNVGVAVEAMKKGAADFLLKPFDREEILFTVRKHLAAARHHDRPPRPEVQMGAVASTSHQMHEVDDLVRRAAMGNASVLIRGESGTGKELAARAIHDSGPRRSAPFVKIHCAALPDTLIESELFGYEKGAFTGAASRKPGRVELAEGGTLFLDEITEMSPETQSKLLRVIQERLVRPVGSTSEVSVDVRLIASTNRNPEQALNDGLLRRDLYYRLHVNVLKVPPLRERSEDIPLLVEHFIALFNERLRPAVPVLGVDGEALAALEGYAWPGNVRELSNTIEAAFTFGRSDTIRMGHLSPEISHQVLAKPVLPAGPLPTFADAERELVHRALAVTGGNKVQAAKLLRISRKKLYAKIDKYGLRGS
jgi:two-component system response regulator AtoC